MSSSEEFRELDQDHDALAIVGKVASSWAILEWCIDATVWHLAGTKEDEGACITSQIGSIHARLRALIALAKLKNTDPKIVKRLNKFYQSCDEVSRLRNRIIHDPWYVGLLSNAVVQHRITADKELKRGLIKRSQTDMNIVLEKIGKLRGQFTVLMDELGFLTSE